MWLATAALTGCSKLVNVTPPITSINTNNVYNDDATASAVLTGLYTNMMNSNSLTSGGLIDLTFYAGLSADELTLLPGLGNATYTGYYTNALTNQNTSSSDFWNCIYPMIYVANSAIEGLNGSNSLTPAVKQQLLGEAEFMRAFCYFYLVNLYGDVPLVLTTNYVQNSDVERTPEVKVWQQIIADLQSAQNLLSPTYLDGTILNATSQRLRPTKWAACALLARVYLYNQQWANAESESDSVIANTSQFSLGSLSEAFLASSTEAIWQLQPVVVGRNTPDAQIFIIPSSGPSSQWPVYLSSSLLNDFEQGDQRRLNWVDSVNIGGVTYYYSYKYKNDTLNSNVDEYEMVLRLGEQYLIRAEAEAEMGGSAINASIADLNLIRKRAGLGSTTASTQSDVLVAIMHERRVELFAEWGNRWLDLKRTGTINAIMGTPGNACAVKGGNWNANWQLYPIQISQIQADPQLTQNAGY